MIDMHLHTKQCRHASGELHQYVSAARDAGLEIVAFSDHLPLPGGAETDYAMRADELDGYVRSVSALRASEHSPRVLLGIEADWMPDDRAHAERLLAAHPFDVVLGSIHFVDGWAFDDPDLIGEYEHRDVDELWRRYFDELRAAARSGLFDVMAHPDLVKKFGFYPEDDPRTLYEETARVFAETGVAFEVNSAGLRKPCAELYPGPDMLRALARAGVPATIGSDAHRPDEVGAGLKEAARALADAGYDSVLYFEGRKPVERGIRGWL